MGPENIFKHKFIIPELKKLRNCYFFIKESGSIRGISDIIGVVNGRFFAWELKKDKKEADKKTGRNALQRYILDIINHCGGIGRFVYPENLEECLAELRKL